MQKASLLGILLVLGALGAIAWLMLYPTAAAGDLADLRDDAGKTPQAAATLAADPGSDAGAIDAQRDTRVAVELAGTSSPGAGPALVGRVLDDGGAPIARATVTCSPAMVFDGDALTDLEHDDPAKMAERYRALAGQRVEVDTDADGGFRIGAPGASRTMDLRVRARGHLVLTQRVQRPIDADVDLGALTLKAGAIVSGRVLDGAGKPVAEATVSRRGKGDTSFSDLEFVGSELWQGIGGPTDGAVTDAEGLFELAHVEPGQFSLRARHAEHPAARMDGLVVEPGKTMTGVVIVVEPGVTIRGRLLGIPDGAKSIRVVAAPRRAEVAEQAPGFGDMLDNGTMAERSVLVTGDGSFTLRGLTTNRAYGVWAVQSGRGFTSNAMCSQRIEVTSGAQGVELRYEAGVTVTCRVVDARSGAPIERLWVHDRLKGGTNDMMVFWTGGGGSRSRPYPDGQVTVANLRPKAKQTLSLTIEAIGFARLERDGIALPMVGVLDLGVVRLEPAPVVHVEVTADGQPVAGALVRLRERRDASQRPTSEFGIFGAGMSGPTSTQSARTDAEGRCQLNGVPGGKVILSATSTAHAPYTSEAITLPAREDHHHRVQLVRGGSVEVTVLEADGTAVATIGVEQASAGGQRETRKTDAKGRVVFDRLAPGPHRFRLGGPGSSSQIHELAMVTSMGGTAERNEPGWESVDVEDGVRTTLQLSKKPGASLQGLVRENGVPLTGAVVTFVERATGDSAASARQRDIAAMMGGGSRTARTDDAGRYQLKDVVAGEHQLRVTHRERAMPAVVDVALRTGENDLDVDLDVNVLRGKVRDAAGKPVAGASVSASAAPTDQASRSGEARIVESYFSSGDFAPAGGGRSGTTTKTDAEGRFELRGVATGAKVVVRVNAKGFAPTASAPVQVASGGASAGVDIELQAAGRVRVQATVEGPFASAQATYAGTDVKGIAPAFQMLRDGSAMLEGLRPGRWKVVLNVPGRAADEPRYADVVAGQTVEVSF